MKDGIDHINDIYGRVSSLELEDRHGYREKISMPFLMADISGSLFSTPDEPHFDAYIAQITVHLANPIIANTCLFSVRKGNTATPSVWDEVWWGPMTSSDAGFVRYLFPTPVWEPTFPYGVIAGSQVSPVWSPDQGDRMQFGIKLPGDGGNMTAFIDWVPQRAF